MKIDSSEKFYQKRYFKLIDKYEELLATFDEQIRIREKEIDDLCKDIKNYFDNYISQFNTIPTKEDIPLLSINSFCERSLELPEMLEIEEIYIQPLKIRYIKHRQIKHGQGE